MKLIFSLAVITNKNQTVEELIKPYIRNNYNEKLEEAIKRKEGFISGVLYGIFDERYDGRFMLLRNEKGKHDIVHKAKIKDVEWQKMVELENELLEEKGIDLKEECVDLEKSFGFTNAIITPDGNWHGMIPLDLITFGFSKEEQYENYIKDYYVKYIKPFEENGSITILSCNM